MEWNFIHKERVVLLTTFEGRVFHKKGERTKKRERENLMCLLTECIHPIVGNVLYLTLHVVLPTLFSHGHS